MREVGLPPGHLAWPLFAFNVGVELGQLATVLAAYMLARAVSTLRWSSLARRPAIYAIGITAAYWSWLRLSALGG